MLRTLPSALSPLARPALLWVVALTLVSACAPAERTLREEGALPPVPQVEGPLDVVLTYPKPGDLRPDVDSTFVFGTTGTGEASLTINGRQVDVAPNGAFLAFVPVPGDGTYRLEARASASRDTEVYTYATPPAAVPAVTAFPQPRLGIVTGSKDTLATGSESAHAAPTPGGDRRWFFPLGTRLTLTGTQGAYYRIGFTGETIGWIDTSAVRLEGIAATQATAAGSVATQPHPRYVDVTIPVAYAPFRIDPQLRTLGVTVYGRSASGPAILNDPLLRDAAWTSAADSAHLSIRLAQGLWGYKTFYNGAGDLVVRVRRPPAIDPQEPLRGIRILIDAGHPPGGAIGPTGLTEAEANLDITRRIEAILQSRGAETLLTRTSPEPIVSATSAAIELWARVDSAVVWNADLLVSVHNNAFPDGVNPFLNYGTETYYYHPFSAPLAEALLEHIAPVTGLPVLGAKQNSLALVRPSWMPSTLTESLFMMFPRQEAALRNPDFLDRLAAAHVAGIETFLTNYPNLPPD